MIVSYLGIKTVTARREGRSRTAAMAQRVKPENDPTHLRGADSQWLQVVA